MTGNLAAPTGCARTNYCSNFFTTYCRHSSRGFRFFCLRSWCGVALQEGMLMQLRRCRHLLTNGSENLGLAPRFHASPSEKAGMTRRGFCPDCGAPVVVKPDAVPQFVAIRTASLDDPSWFKPQMDVWRCGAPVGRNESRAAEACKISSIKVPPA
jgi:hypothetical protein